MVKEIQFTNIRRVLDNLKDDENMQNLTLEQVVRHTLRFMEKFSYPKFYEDRQADIEIHQFRGMLPCDLVSIVQVKDCHTGICMRSMTDSFNRGLEEHPSDLKPGHGPIPDVRPGWDGIPFEHSWKTQGRIIYTSFPEGMIEIAYKAIQVDGDGFPKVIDNDVYLDALESYIILKVYTAKFRSGKLASGILQEVQQSYALAAKALETEFTTPSYSEMESMTREFNHIIPRVRQFDRAFRHLGDREYIRRH